MTTMQRWDGDASTAYVIFHINEGVHIDGTQCHCVVVSDFSRGSYVKVDLDAKQNDCRLYRVVQKGSIVTLDESPL